MPIHFKTGKIGGTFFAKKVPPNPFQEILTLAEVLISQREIGTSAKARNS
jgi:hypothetical protein